MNDDDLLTATEAARLIGRNHSTVSDWARRGLLNSVGRKKGGGGSWTWAYSRADVLRVHAETPTQDEFHEPTEAELDVMIAEQMCNLPAWWNDETNKSRTIDVWAIARLILAKSAKRTKIRGRT